MLASAACTPVESACRATTKHLHLNLWFAFATEEAAMKLPQIDRASLRLLPAKILAIGVHVAVVPRPNQNADASPRTGCTPAVRAGAVIVALCRDAVSPLRVGAAST